MTTLSFLYWTAEIMVTVAVAHLASMSAKETHAFVPHPYAQAAHMNTLKRQKGKYRFLWYFK